MAQECVRSYGFTSHALVVQEAHSAVFPKLLREMEIKTEQIRPIDAPARVSKDSKRHLPDLIVLNNPTVSNIVSIRDVNVETPLLSILYDPDIISKIAKAGSNYCLASPTLSSFQHAIAEAIDEHRMKQRSQLPDDFHFSKTEAEILSLLSGKGTKLSEFQDQGINPRTARSLISRLRQKLGEDFIRINKEVGYFIPGE